MAAAAAAPEPNLVLAGRYRLEQRLGGGGMGSIWRAEHLVLRAPVAVKLLDREAIPDEGTVARFLREAQSAATLRSPHVVQIIDYGVDGPFPFIVMELLEGENLAQRIKRHKRLSPEDTLRFMAHVGRAVARAHEAGIVHRDLKPENVFLVHNEDDEIAKVLDFGVAKVSSTVLDKDSARTRTGSILGTPYYMSPEQAQGNKTVDKRSDLWSLGVIAFECLTGTRPFYSDGLGDLVLSICVRDIPVPSERAPVPIGFDAWFAKAVARDPDHRFQNARKMIDSLRDALGVETERASDPDIVVSSAELSRETVRSGEPTSERDTEEERPPNSAIPTVVRSGAPGGDSDRGSAIQVSSGRRSSESEADVNAATVVAQVPDTDIPALTESQFGTSQGAAKDRRTSLGPVIA
ncbi:MAG TPA: serine/threonine-protein kinase, partial [Polyangiaceae bacterium]|nr:serine/threonine-protein kinase [Polyangiaceae bacterium]